MPLRVGQEVQEVLLAELMTALAVATNVATIACDNQPA